MACSQFVHIYRRNEGNFSLSAAPIITNFFRLHKQIIFHYCDHYLRSHHLPAVSFRTGVHDPGSWLPLSSRVTALENSGHLFERSELCPRTQAFCLRTETGFCRCFAFQIGKIRSLNCIIRNFQFRKFLYAKVAAASTFSALSSLPGG